MSFSGLSPDVMKKLQNSTQARVEREQGRLRGIAREKEQAEKRKLLELSATRVYLDAYKAELDRINARPHPYPPASASKSLARLQKSTDRQCFICKKPISDSSATTLDVGGGLTLQAHARCLIALKEVVEEQPVDVRLPVGKTPVASPSMRKAGCEKGVCTAVMSKAYPGFIQLGNKVYSRDRFIQEFGDTYDIKFEED